MVQNRGEAHFKSGALSEIVLKVMAAPAVAAQVFLRCGLDRRRLRRRRGRVRLGALSEWRSVPGVGRAGGILLHLSAVLQRAPVQPASRPLRPLPQSLLEQLHLPDTLQRNGLLPMPSR